MKKDRIKELEENLKKVFENYTDRRAVEEELSKMNFKIWNPNMLFKDEQIWYYDDGSLPNMPVILLINWIDGFFWIYKREWRYNFVAGVESRD